MLILKTTATPCESPWLEEDYELSWLSLGLVGQLVKSISVAPQGGSAAAPRMDFGQMLLLSVTAQHQPQKSEDTSQIFRVNPAKPASPKASGQL